MEGHVCESCEKPATLRCPTCLKQYNKDSYFCSQDCFKSSWKSHKATHPKAKPASTFNPFPGYSFTGKLRPVYPLSELRVVPPHIGRPDYADHPQGKSESEWKAKSSRKIHTLTPEEVEKTRKVCKLAREILEEGRKAVRIGVTTDEIDRVVHEANVERNCYPSSLNYYGFPKSCCTSVNEVICHGIPDGYALQDGDIVNIDVSCVHDGFHADLNATYLAGNVDEAGRRLVKNARECLDKAIATVKPGMLYRDIGTIIQKHAQSEGFSVVRSYCGHGVGRFLHCPPDIPHYAKNKAVGVMKPGHVFTIEPMVSEGVWQDKHWPDNWTCVTMDGKRSAQFEETLLVTETGVEILTARTEQM
ncbi:Methionine aminopeptidase 1 [Borealophlyctis nickersoniae]|nr:Methionine aminopeptidase 1 [Borealophlyctis nickersoniae]